MGCCPMQATKSCAVAPCISYLWQTGTWSACANGKSSRSVFCVDSHGSNATDEVDFDFKPAFGIH